jgi:sarcosine oxidase subunit gamma
MLERRSALAGFRGAAEQPGVDGAVGLEIGEVTGWSLTEIGVYPSQRAEGERAVGAWLGFVPARIDTPVETPIGLLMRTGPLSFWLIGPAGAETAGDARKAMPATAVSIIDLSSSRTRLSIAGRAAPDVLLKGISLDFAPESFVPGRVALTGVHHTPIVLHRLAADRFEIYAMRTFALSVLEWLTDAAREFGYRVRQDKTAGG